MVINYKQIDLIDLKASDQQDVEGIRAVHTGKTAGDKSCGTPKGKVETCYSR